MTAKDIKLIEINEAFAPMLLVSSKINTDGDEALRKELL